MNLHFLFTWPVFIVQQIKETKTLFVLILLLRPKHGQALTLHVLYITKASTFYSQPGWTEYWVEGR